jgi:outer membrane immunogenic protein
MKKILLASVALIALVGTAAAADLPTKGPVYKAPAYAAYNWTGFYIGINGGGGWGNTTWNDTVPGNGSWKTSGWLVGATAGYNWQAPGSAFVFGIEGDIDAANINGTGNNPDCVALVNCQTKSTWLGTIRGRGGYAWDRWLAFVTGGGAFGNIQASAAGTPTESSSRFGWTLGGGVEYAFAGPWSLKAEYLYVDLGNFSCSANACGVPAPTTVSHTVNIVRAGLNYRF